MTSQIRFRLRNDLYCVEWGVKLYSLPLHWCRSGSDRLCCPLCDAVRTANVILKRNCALYTCTLWRGCHNPLIQNRSRREYMQAYYPTENVDCQCFSHFRGNAEYIMAYLLHCHPSHVQHFSMSLWHLCTLMYFDTSKVTLRNVAREKGDICWIM